MTEGWLIKSGTTSSGEGFHPSVFSILWCGALLSA
jgi:hypothetical protein